jgi:hypothetical protein
MNVTAFVRGMAWHDIAKPLWLRNTRHNQLGFSLLSAAGYSEEALVALAHAERDMVSNLRKYLRNNLQVTAVSPLLAFSPLLDRLAASTYALVDKELTSTDTIHTFQNPFSRLPLPHPFTQLPVPPQLKNHHERFILASDPDRKRVKELQLQKMDTIFQDYFKSTLSSDPSLAAAITAVIEQAYHSDTNPLTNLELVSDPETFLQPLHDLLPLFPERTYPPVNDTSLQSHMRLSGILAFVLFQNLIAASHPVLKQQVFLDGLTVKLGENNLADSINDIHTIGLENLQATLVRIAFTGHEDLFNTAVRLDDLHGARRLGALMRTFFKKGLANYFEAPELASFLPLFETEFELVYLMPGHLSEAELAALVDQVYRASCAEVVHHSQDGLLRLLYQDFQQPSVSDPIFFTPDVPILVRQIETLGYGLRQVSIEMDTYDDFDTYSSNYGLALLKAFTTSLSHVSMPTVVQERTRNYLNQEENETTAVCAACGVHPRYEPLWQRLQPGHPDADFFRKVTHIFRGQPEPLCLSCMARRPLAHGVVQSPPLAALLHFDAQSGEVTAQANETLSLPPALLRQSVLPHGDFSNVDLGAAYVRRRRDNPAVLDIFPTIAYAADSDSNVILLSLQPTDNIFKAHYFNQLSQIGNLPSGEVGTIGQYLADTIQPFYLAAQKIDAEKSAHGEASDLVKQVTTARPHIARVLERVEHIRRYYQSFYRALLEAGIRTLPIDIEYPTMRLLVPADRFERVLQVLYKSICTDLFSLPSDQWPVEHLVLQMLPPILRGTAVAFKQKQALYLVLEAERTLMKRLTHTKKGRWHGLILSMTDMRSTLSNEAGWYATLSLPDMASLLAIARVDRRTMVEAAVTLARQDIDDAALRRNMAEARLFIRRDWHHLGPKETAQLMQPQYFEPLLFLKTVTKGQ